MALIPQFRLHSIKPIFLFPSFPSMNIERLLKREENVPQTGPFEPADASWTYDANDSTDVHAMFISSSNRLQNGNTFVNFGPQGKFVEVTPDGEVVWEYWSPYIGDVKLPGGLSPQPVGPFKFAVFRATHIEANHPALTGKDLAPLPEQPAVAEFPLNP